MVRRDEYVDEKSGFTIKIRHEIEESPSYDYLGRLWGERKGEGNRNRPDFPFYDRLFDRVFMDEDEREAFFAAPEQQARELFDELYADEAWDDRKFRYIVPHANDYRDVADKEERRKYLTQDADRLQAWFRDEWQYIGIVAEAWWIKGEHAVKLGEASIWGVEDDTEDKYIKEIESEVADDAIQEATNAAHQMALAWNARYDDDRKDDEKQRSAEFLLVAAQGIVIGWERNLTEPMAVLTAAIERAKKAGWGRS